MFLKTLLQSFTNVTPTKDVIKELKGLIYVPIVYKYILREILRFMGILMVALLIIYFVVDFFEKIDNFLDQDLSVLRAIIFFLFKIPFLITQMIPLCLLLSVTIVFGLMNKNKEILALKSSGISVFYLSIPVLALGMLSSFILFLLSEIIVPVTIEKSNRIWREEVKKISAVTSGKQNIWMKLPKKIIHIKNYKPREKTIFGVSVYNFDEDFRLIRRVDAEKGVFSPESEQSKKKRGVEESTGAQWILYKLMEQNIEHTNGRYDVKFSDRSVEELDLLPDDLLRVVKRSEEMNFTELMEFIDKVNSEGYNTNAYRVDLYAKISFPLVCIFVGIIGAGIASISILGERLAVSIALSIGVAFLYWTLHGLFVSLGYGEILQPLVAAWITNVLFLIFGIFVLVNAE